MSDWIPHSAPQTLTLRPRSGAQGQVLGRKVEEVGQ
jgi:hypothetical protein